MKKYISKAYCIAFILLFLFPTILFEIAKPYIDTSNSEQRAAAQKPVLSLQTLEEYPQQFEEYYNDHLPFRTQLVRANNALFLNVFKQSPVDKVIMGKDGWLFFNPRGKDGDPIADYQGTGLLMDYQLEGIADNLIQTRDKLRGLGKEFVLLVAPNKASLYGDAFLPDQYIKGNGYTLGDQLVDYLRANTDLTVVYPKKVLQEAIQNDPDHIYYYKTDTHWNELGSYIGAAELLKVLGISMPELSELQITSTDTFAGDLAKMTEQQSLFAYDYSYTVHGYTDHPATIIAEDSSDFRQYRAENADERSVLIVRDSFSLALYPYLSSQFQNTTFVHRDAFSQDMLSDCPSDIVVVQIVERYWEYLLYYFNV